MLIKNGRNGQGAKIESEINREKGGGCLTAPPGAIHMCKMPRDKLTEEDTALQKSLGKADG